MDSFSVFVGVILFYLMGFCTLFLLFAMYVSFQEGKECELINSGPCVWQMMPIVKGQDYE